MKNQLAAVQLFHKTFKAPVANEITVNIPLDRKLLRFNLMKEENEEYLTAVKDNNIIEVADALGDMLYILCGTIIEHGLQHKIEAVFNEIQQSNMSKADQNGNPIFREDGKILKGPNYFKPRIYKVLCDEPIEIHDSNKVIDTDKIANFIPITKTELQSQSTRIDWAEDLITQLPLNHDGRNSWLLNYGKKSQAIELRSALKLSWNESTQSAQQAIYTPPLQKGNRKLISIAAMSNNEVIAVDGKIPWHLPNDFKHFKQTTEGHHIIMGRKTFDSLPGILPNRTHVVITNDKMQVSKWSTTVGVIIVHSLQQAINTCPDNETSYIIGGAEIYKQTMDIVDELDLTIVETHINTTNSNVVYFPPGSTHADAFDHISQQEFEKDDTHQYDYSFIRLVRRDQFITPQPTFSKQHNINNPLQLDTDGKPKY